MRGAGGDLSDRAPFWLLCAVQLALCLHYFPPREIFSGEPVLTSDWAQHYFQAVRTARYLRDGSLVGYCTTWSAGFVDGFVGLVNNKPFALAIFLVPERFHPLAFNLAVLFSLFLFPPLIHGAARAFGHDRRQAAAAMSLAIACWYGSMLFRVFWRGGSALFGVGVGVALWSAAALHARWRYDGPGASLPAVVLAAALVPWIHAGALFVFAVLAACVYLATFRARGLRLGEVTILGAVTLGASLPWLWPFVRHRDLRRSLDYGIYPGGLANLWFDFVRGPLHLGPGPREETAILVPLVLLAALAVPSLRRRSPLLAVLGSSAAVFAVLAYGGRALGAGALQPYRFVIPLAGVLAIAAAAALREADATRGRSPIRLAVALVAALLVADRLRVAARATDYLGAGLGATESAALEAFRALAAPDGRRVEGRILVEGDWIGEPVADRPWSRRVSYSFVGFEGELDAELIGAPVMSVAAAEEEASFWRGRLFGRNLADWDREAFSRLCRAYDIRWALTIRDGTAAWLRGFAPDVAEVGGSGRVAIFRIDAPSATAAVVATSGDRRTIEATLPDASPRVLPYHWNRLLTASPSAELRPVPSGVSSDLRFVEIVPPAAGRYRIGLSPGAP